MLKTEEDDQLPPPRFDEDSNTIAIDEGSKSGASNQPTLEDLMKNLEKLKAENKKLRAKEKKAKVYSYSSENGNFKEEVSKKGRKGRKHDKLSYNYMFFNYNNMSSSTAYTSISVGKPPHFDGTNYNQWKHWMKNYLYSLSPEVWQVVCDGIDFPDEDE
jgi:hypothetical protein